MTTSTSSWIQREKGEAPLSIGTSLALESLGGFGEFPSASPPIFKYNEMWVNLRTLIRNCFNAVERGQRIQVLASDLIEPLLEDIQVLLSTVELKSMGRLTVKFYYNTFKRLANEFPKAKIKTPSTDKQIFEYALEEKILSLFLKDYVSTLDNEVHEFDVRFKAKGDNAVILTHHPVDLLWRKQFRQLTLLESHSGALKPRAEWYTKLTGGRRYDRIPFNRLTLQVFGDGNTQFSSMSSKIKNRLLTLAEEGRWTPVTTDEKVRYTLNKLYDPGEKQFYLDLLSR